jgi:hypothetical protein
MPARNVLHLSHWFMATSKVLTYLLRCSHTLTLSRHHAPHALSRTLTLSLSRYHVLASSRSRGLALVSHLTPPHLSPLASHTITSHTITSHALSRYVSHYHLSLSRVNNDESVHILSRRKQRSQRGVVDRFSMEWHWIWNMRCDVLDSRRF